MLYMYRVTCISQSTFYFTISFDFSQKPCGQARKVLIHFSVSRPAFPSLATTLTWQLHQCPKMHISEICCLISPTSLTLVLSAFAH